MVETTILMRGQEIRLPPIHAGDPPASLSDHQPGGVVLVVLACAADDRSASLSVSRAGAHAEIGAMRLIESVDYAVERTLSEGESYERPIRTRAGVGVLRMVHRRA